MKKLLLLSICFVCCFLWVNAQPFQTINYKTSPVDWVNPLMGTDSKYSLSNGNTYPAIAMPWGMNFWTPQTGGMGDGWAYTYSSEKINGFKQTHQPSPWMNDYGQFAIMPVNSSDKITIKDRASWFSHKTEISKPYYYSVFLADHDVTAEITPTERAAQLVFTFPESDSASIVIDAFDKGSYVKIIPGQKKLIGYTTKNSGGAGDHFKNYFVIYFDHPFKNASIWHDSTVVTNQLEYEGDHAGAIIHFTTSGGEKINLKTASSFISFDQAELNLTRELGNDSFDDTKKKARDRWNEMLSRIKIEGGTETQIATFYSCLYRTLCFPQKMYELDQNNEIMHYSPYNSKVMPGYLFAGTGFWDTFRALYPLLNLLYPEINVEMQKGLVSGYKEGGFLPEWSSPGYRDVMVGNNSASIVADAYLKGLRGYDIGILYEALIHGANNEGPMSAVGRKGYQLYNELGYVPADAGINESVARTLEYAYDDFTIAELGKVLGKPKSEIDVYLKRAMNYKHLFDPETKLMRPKNRDGSFVKNFDPLSWGGAFTEGNSWHYSWSVFQDIAGLKKLMGGDKMFVRMLDSVFKMPPTVSPGGYGFIIHEMREMQIINMGQYAHGNQPIQHMIYLYNYAGQPWKTQYWVRQVMEKLYLPTPDGYCGDEDNGQTSAWYVFSAMGFYPVCPGAGQYVLGAPLFKKMTLSLPNKKSLTLNAKENSPRNIYIQSLKRNGEKVTKNWFSHEELMAGGVIDWLMDDEPDMERGTNVEDYPFSISK